MIRRKKINRHQMILSKSFIGFAASDLEDLKVNEENIVLLLDKSSSKYHSEFYPYRVDYGMMASCCFAGCQFRLDTVSAGRFKAAFSKDYAKVLPLDFEDTPDGLSVAALFNPYRDALGVFIKQRNDAVVGYLAADEEGDILTERKGTQAYLRYAG